MLTSTSLLFAPQERLDVECPLRPESEPLLTTVTVGEIGGPRRAAKARTPADKWLA